MNLVTMAIDDDPIVVAWEGNRCPDAIFHSGADAAEWCQRQAPSCGWPGDEPTGVNPAIAICNGRLIRARDCFNRRHLRLALKFARRGKPVGEAFQLGAAR